MVPSISSPKEMGGRTSRGQATSFKEITHFCLYSVGKNLVMQPVAGRLWDAGNKHLDLKGISSWEGLCSEKIRKSANFWKEISNMFLKVQNKS